MKRGLQPRRADLLRLKVDVIVSPGPALTRPAKEATFTIAIVMTQHTDPGADGANYDTGSVNLRVIRRDA